jgi:hypothetical protein
MIGDAINTKLLLPVVFGLVGEREERTMWKRGRPVLGFFSGLVMGLGVAITLQQFGVWTLSIVTAIAFPAFGALVGMARGIRGRAFTVEFAEAPPPPPPEEP